MLRDEANDAAPGLARLTLEDLRSRGATCSIPEAGALLGLGRAAAYEAARRGDLPMISLGSRKRCPVAQLERLLEGTHK